MGTSEAGSVASAASALVGAALACAAEGELGAVGPVVMVTQHAARRTAQATARHRQDLVVPWRRAATDPPALRFHHTVYDSGDVFYEPNVCSFLRT
eukprot:CAMPEP_0206166280 /NCGR_PEP_ID=MMETSP1474-20131121/23582_1 /ASSEMBLY_ACC=CAM_ASM_001110 /TAXON_ID=97495 /ORGANISM="Imantonia sp., Strain RCC918" /LENGTH=95 /DNA_ID=CAMNT_0053570203 /DNA_START=850 /DNA_END=1138 /DNA_ORIENTATION=-